MVFLLVVVLLVGGGILANKLVTDSYDSWGNFFVSIFGGGGQGDELNATLKDPEVEQTTQGGASAHKITVYAYEDSVVYIDDLKLQAKAQDGKVVFVVNDDTLKTFPVEAGASEIVFELSARVVSKDRNYKVDIPRFTIPVEATPLTILAPTQQSFSTIETSVKIELQTKEGARVHIGENNLSSLVDKEGKLSYTLQIDWEGKKDIPVTAIAGSMAQAQYILSIDKQIDELKIELNPSPVAETNDATIVIHGYCVPGAKIVVNDDTSIVVEQSADGKFNFTANLNYGTNNLTIKASNDEGKQSNKIVTIFRRPLDSEYTTKAQAMDYDRIVKNNANLIGKIFICEGEIKEVLEPVQPKSQRLLMDLGDGKEIILDYLGNAKLSAGKKYKVFADVAGMQDGKPLMNGWYATAIQ